MRRVIVDFVLDDREEWIAQLSCGHAQHVRHRPPFQESEWILGAETRRARLGRYLLCPLCDRAELPAGLHLLRKSPMWDEETAPSGLKNSHHLAEGTWGVITVESGELRFLTDGEIVINKIIPKSSTQAIPPGLDHRVELEGPVRFSIDYLSRDREYVPSPAAEEPGDRSEGGEPACLLHMVCTVCGAVVEGDAHLHRPG